MGKRTGGIALTGAIVGDSRDVTERCNTTCRASAPKLPKTATPHCLRPPSQSSTQPCMRERLCTKFFAQDACAVQRPAPQKQIIYAEEPRQFYVNIEEMRWRASDCDRRKGPARTVAPA